MHVYLVEISRNCLDVLEEKLNAKIRYKIREVLDSNYSVKKTAILRQFITAELKVVLRTHAEKLQLLMLGVDTMWNTDTPDKKSFFISVKIQDQKPLYLYAQYKELNSLEEVAAWEVSRNLRSLEHLQQLVLNADIPSKLMSEVKRFL